MTWLGRWERPDPIGVGDGLNRFAYAGGNPVSFFDQAGLNALDDYYGSTTPDQTYATGQAADQPLVRVGILGTIASPISEAYQYTSGGMLLSTAVQEVTKYGLEHYPEETKATLQYLDRATQGIEVLEDAIPLPSASRAIRTSVIKPALDATESAINAAEAVARTTVRSIDNNISGFGLQPAGGPGAIPASGVPGIDGPIVFQSSLPSRRIRNDEFLPGDSAAGKTELSLREYVNNKGIRVKDNFIPGAALAAPVALIRDDYEFGPLFFHDAISHANPKGPFEAPILGGSYDGAMYLQRLRESQAYTPGTPIRLVACYGAYWCQSVADALDVPVLATDQAILPGPNGVLRIGDYDELDRFQEQGHWFLAYPGER